MGDSDRICPKCGNTWSFIVPYTCSMTWVEEERIEGPTQEIVVVEPKNVTRQKGGCFCERCGTGVNETVDIEEEKYKHTRKDGTWSVEELKESDRDPENLARCIGENG